MDGDEPRPITDATGVNVLIGGKDNLPFADYLSRAVWVEVDGLRVPCISHEDDNALPRPAAHHG